MDPTLLTCRPVCRPVREAPHRSQRGVGALSVTMLLLFAASIAAFHLNRGLVFEQRASANQLRSTAAFELAEAGVEWATGMLNSPLHIGADCRPLPASGASFRRRFLQTGFPANTALAVAPSALAVCRFQGDALACRCAAGEPTAPTASSGEAAAIASPEAADDQALPGFAVAFTPVMNPATGAIDPAAVRVIATGCPVMAGAAGPVRQAGACSPATTTAGRSADPVEGSATVSVILKRLPGLRSRPSAALTCGGDCTVDGAATLVNTEATVGGLLVQAGGRVSAGAGAQLLTLPGQPVASALVGADLPLAALAGADASCAASRLFSAFFGMSLAQHGQSGDGVISLPGCTEAASCGARIGAAFDAGWRSFHFPDGLALDASAPFQSLGSPRDGVRLVSAGPMRIDGPLRLHGLVVSNSPGAADLDTGSADIQGAVIACGAHRQGGVGRLVYSASALDGAGFTDGAMVRVPGSWRDF